MSIRAIFFDMDGVLVDSLRVHLRYCAKLAREFGIDLTIHDPEEFKKVVRSGKRISPMLHFFNAVGFSEEYARRGDERYRAEFAGERIELFPGVDQMLSLMSTELDLPLGLITSNVRNAVESALGSSMRFFRPECVFADDDEPRMTKAEAIEAGTCAIGITPDDLLFVGDQFADRDAAASVGAQFLGVTYGWGIAPEDTELDLAGSPEEIARFTSKLASTRNQS